MRNASVDIILNKLAKQYQTIETNLVISVSVQCKHCLPSSKQRKTQINTHK